MKLSTVFPWIMHYPYLPYMLRTIWKHLQIWQVHENINFLFKIAFLLRFCCLAQTWNISCTLSYTFFELKRIGTCKLFIVELNYFRNNLFVIHNQHINKTIISLTFSYSNIYNTNIFHYFINKYMRNFIW